MAGAYRRRVEGKLADKFTCWWRGADGKKHTCVGTAERKSSLAIANQREIEARLIREGLLDPAERRYRESRLKPVKDHVQDYHDDLLAKGDTKSHAKHVAGVLTRILADASIKDIADMPSDKIQASIARMMVRGKDAQGRLKKRGRPASARTKNHALRSVRSFTTWLCNVTRIKEVPRGLALIPFYPEEADRRRQRRALTMAELERLLEATAHGETMVTRRPGRGRSPHGWLTGPERVILYRIAMGTGFRATELGTLIPESFALDGDDPSITVRACYSKRGKRSGRDDVQPIRRELAELLKPWLAGKEPGKPVLACPEKTAEMLRADLAAAGIPYETKAGIVDFHSLRHSYITHLAASGLNPKTVQKLARHSTITLTLDRYFHLEDGDLRKALEGEE